MIFFHIIDDYVLQAACLSKLKQKGYWEKSIHGKIYQFYRYDYIVALIMHAFSWSFMISLPFAIEQRFKFSVSYIVMLIVNTIIHAIVDNLKANKGKINLICDQTIHILQIIITYLIISYL
jgi:hypothetical protein